MKKKSIDYTDTESCPVRNILDRFGDKWSILILLILKQEEVLRFNQLHKMIGSISQKVLSTTLKKLYPEVPPRVEYRLTSRSLTLIPHIQELVNWANENIDAIKTSRAAFQQG